MKQISLVLAGLLLAGCSATDCGKAAYRSPCVPVEPLQSAAPETDECGKPVYTAPHCPPAEDVEAFFGGLHQDIFGCPSPK
jgi:hypothetical protein